MHGLASFYQNDFPSQIFPVKTISLKAAPPGESRLRREFERGDRKVEGGDKTDRQTDRQQQGLKISLCGPTYVLRI